MPVRLSGSTSGYTELAAPATAGNNSITLPTSNGNAYQIVRNGATAGSLEYADKLVLGTAQNSTSGTSIDFTGIPSWVKRVTVTGINVSTSGTSIVCLRLGTSSGVASAGYVSNHNTFNGNTVSNNGAGTGEFAISGNITAADIRQFSATIIQNSGNAWVFSSVAAATNATGNTSIAAGAIILGGTLDRVRITTVNGTDTFDAGSINIMYE
jgi:hypothetical protein